jgi:hypothetical protein
MSDKFKYAPGKPGFGTKGDDGSVGLQGLAMYFTDIDPVSGKNTINLRISSNLDLWTSSGNFLPGGRIYVTGDLFFDTDGKAYEINAETDTFVSMGGSLNMGGFFVPLGISTDNGFQRYFNSNNSPKYIIDNVYTQNGAINYTESPLTIYGIEPKNFARIEYNNVVFTVGSNRYNPFTVYSATPNGIVDDSQSIAIVRDASHNSFRIGNLDDTGVIRNVNLIFDVSSLIHTKQPGNYFNANTPRGSVLTNYEINANTLFDPNFNRNPASFFVNMSIMDASISWNLLDFTNDPTVTGDIYFFENLAPFTTNTFSINSMVPRPLIFSNVGASGKISITGFSTTKTYGYYMKLTKNGWTRNSDIKYAFLGYLSAYPSTYTDISSGAGTLSAFDVSTNFTWNASIWQNPDNFISSISCPSIGGLDGSINITVIANDTSHNRIGKIRVGLLPGGSPYQDVTFIQPAGIILPTLSLHSLMTQQFYGWSPNYYFDVSQNGVIGYLGLFVNVSTGATNYWETTSDSGVSINPTSNIGPVGPPYNAARVSCTPNNTMTLEERTITFTYGGASPVYLNMRVEPVESWIEFTWTSERFEWDMLSIPLEFDSAGDPIGPGAFNGQINIKFTNGVAIPWTITLPSPNPQNISFSQYSGTGDTDYIYINCNGSPGSSIVEVDLGGTSHAIRIQKNY